jgi:hypothetical protein
MGKGYPLGTRVQHRTGYIVVKVETDGGDVKMMAESRRMWELHRGDLAPGDRVFHMDGDRTNNNIRNLAKIHFNQTKFVLLKESKILFMPTIRTLDKKTGRVLVNS